MGLGGVNHTHHKPFMNQVGRETDPVRARRLHHHKDSGRHMTGGLELVHKLGMAFGRLVNGERPTGGSPSTLYGDGCGRRRDIDAHEKRIGLCCLACPHGALHSPHTSHGDSTAWMSHSLRLSEQLSSSCVVKAT